MDSMKNAGRTKPTVSLLLGIMLLLFSGFMFSQNDWEEHSVDVVLPVGPGDYVYKHNPGCGGDTNSALQSLFRAYADSKLPGIGKYAGPILDGIATETGKFIKKNIRGSLGKYLSRFTNPSANCRIIALAIPSGSKYSGYRYEIFGHPDTNWHKVKAGQDFGWCMYSREPQCKWTKNGGIVHTVFKNWSHNITRKVRLTVWFKMPPNEYAPSR